MLRVLSIGRHACIRQQKQLIALRKYVDIHLLTEKSVSFGQYARTLTRYMTQAQFRDAIRMLHDRVDLYHVHTEPFWYVQAIREVFPDAPIILDLHDSQYLRFPDEPAKHSTEERAAIEQADALVYVSEGCRAIIEEWVPQAEGKPHAILPSYVNERFYKLLPWGRVGGLANEGRMDTKKAGPWYDYCKYHDLTEAMHQAGLPFYLYGNNDEKTCAEYDRLGAETMGQHGYESLIRNLGSHDWGLCGNLAPYPEWAVAFPNKLFEYLAAGIPVVAMHADAVAEFVVPRGLGIQVSSVAELKARWEERARCQAEVFKQRFDWTMEKHVHRLTELYDRLLGPRIHRLSPERASSGGRDNGDAVAAPGLARA